MGGPGGRRRPPAGRRVGTAVVAGLALAATAMALPAARAPARAATAPAVAGAAVPASAPTAPVRRTSTGAIGPETTDRIAITAFQHLLLRFGWIVPLDGAWGPETRDAVAEFQTLNGLEVTGVIDDATRSAFGDPGAVGAPAERFDMLVPQRAPDPMFRIEEVADRTGFDWRGVGGEYVFGCAPSTIQERCTMGSFVTLERRMYVSPYAFASQELLEYVVLHEQAHLWQFTSCPPPLRAGCLAPFGYSGLAALESGADCLVLHWGVRFPGYYGCPEGAVPVVGELFESTID